ncbi:MAG: T9SS type A sorting domain-containing protein [Tannerella sp.]|jgi:hypothetical protein|nr:T9SS type A sorting domain-containing protein [Tannerella sp.]
MKIKITIFVLTAILLLGAMPMQSQGLFVYQTDAPKQSFPLETLQKLTFTATDLVVNKKDGTTTSFAFDHLKFFSSYDFTTSGVISAPKAAEEVDVYVEGDAVIVKSNQTITGVHVFDLQGRKLLQHYSESREISLSLASYTAGVYLIQVANENGITTKKIIKK